MEEEEYDEEDEEEKEANKEDNDNTGEKLKSIVGVFRHADRSPKQKLKFVVKNPEILSLFDLYYNNNIIKVKDGKEIANDLKLKKPQELLGVYNIIDNILNKIKNNQKEIEKIKKNKIFLLI